MCKNERNRFWFYFNCGNNKRETETVENGTKTKHFGH